MSNLSQFFATGGNKIKKIQRVQGSQLINGSGSYVWSTSATISPVDPNKTIVVYNTMASNTGIIYGNGSVLSGHNQFGHYAYLSGTSTIIFDGPSASYSNTFNGFYGSGAQLDVQIIEFE